MQILQVARQFYPKVGGIESCVLNLSRGLIARGHTVEVVTLNRDIGSGQPLDGPSELDGIRIHRIRYFGSRRYPIAPSWLRYINDFDLVHIHAIDFFIDSAAVATLIGGNRKPIVVTTHGGIFHTIAWRTLKRIYWRVVLKQSLKAAAKVVAVSAADASLFRSIVPADRLITIPNGIEPVFRDASVPRVRGRIICVGRVNKTKNVDSVVRLIAAVAPEFDELELVVAGPDENGTAATLRREADALGVGSRLRIMGELPGEELATLVASAHVFISAARHEGFGITTVEALSAGVPVLVVRTGVHDQIVSPGVNGWFWSGLPDTEAVEVLRSVLLLPDAQLDEMCVAARASAAPFEWNIATEEYERVFESASGKTVR